MLKAPWNSSSRTEIFTFTNWAQVYLYVAPVASPQPLICLLNHWPSRRVRACRFFTSLWNNDFLPEFSPINIPLQAELHRAVWWLASTDVRDYRRSRCKAAGDSCALISTDSALDMFNRVIQVWDVTDARRDYSGLGSHSVTLASVILHAFIVKLRLEHAAIIR